MNRDYFQKGLVGYFVRLRQRSSLHLGFTGLIVLLLGCFFYLGYQTKAFLPANSPLWQLVDSYTIKLFILGSLPSFVHALGWGLLISSLTVASRRQLIQGHLLVLSLSLVLESRLGTYDQVDVLALIAGTALSLFVGLYFTIKRKSNGNEIRYTRRLVALLVAVSGLFAVASYSQQADCARFEGNSCVQQKRFATPLYMNYSELRSAVQLEDPHDLTEISRIYLYKSLMFMNERNQGVHIIDNRFPANPRPIGFVRIPGNLDISIRGDFLYADSYVDLVTLDLTDINNIQEVSRQTDIFPFDAFQNIPFDIDFLTEDIDAGRGVIVGFRE